MKIIIFLILLCIFSCRSIQYVPVETKTETKDSVTTRDSTVIKEKIVTRDSTVIKDSTVIIVDDKGNVLRTELYRYRDRYRELNNDYLELKHKYDSLSSLKRDTIQVAYPVEVIKVKYRVPGVMWWLVIGLTVVSLPSIIKLVKRLKPIIFKLFKI